MLTRPQEVLQAETFLPDESVQYPFDVPTADFSFPPALVTRVGSVNPFLVP